MRRHLDRTIRELHEAHARADLERGAATFDAPRPAEIDDRPGADFAPCSEPGHAFGCPGLAGGDHVWSDTYTDGERKPYGPDWIGFEPSAAGRAAFDAEYERRQRRGSFDAPAGAGDDVEAYRG